MHVLEFNKVTVAVLKGQIPTELEDVSAEVHCAMQVYLKPRQNPEFNL